MLRQPCANGICLLSIASRRCCLRQLKGICHRTRCQLHSRLHRPCAILNRLLARKSQAEVVPSTILLHAQIISVATTLQHLFHISRNHRCIMQAQEKESLIESSA